VAENGRLKRTVQRLDGETDLPAIPATDGRNLQRRLYRYDGAVEGEIPVAVVLPASATEVQLAVNNAREAGHAVVPRGAGTGLSGGAAPATDAVVVSLMKLDGIGEINTADEMVWVEPGVRNLELSEATRPLGYLFAPDPSSQSASTVGGNVATNAGGPRCYAFGSTTSHVLAVDMVLPDGSRVVVGDAYADPIGLDLRSVVLGSEGTLGVTVRLLARLMPVPEVSRTVLCGFHRLEDAGAATAAIVRSGVNATSIELMDQLAVEMCERFTGGGLPLDAAAILLCEVEGSADSIEEDMTNFVDAAEGAGAYLVQPAVDDDQADKWWRARKGAFGAIAQLAPDYHLHDGVVPRTRLVEALREVQRIAAESGQTMTLIAHAGDGNLHPLVPFDGRDEAEAHRVHEMSDQVMEVCLSMGGAVSGEHGIGSTKRHLMDRVFSDTDLDYQCAIKRVFDPGAVMNPLKVLPSPSSCAEPVIPPDSEMWV
jgi:glycolate oxidase